MTAGFLVLMGLALLATVLAIYFVRKRTKNPPVDYASHTFIEIIATKESDLSSIRVRSLLNKLHLSIGPANLYERILGKSNQLYLFIDAKKAIGLRLIVACPDWVTETITNQIIAIDPSLEVAKIAYQPEFQNTDTVYYRLSRHYSYPLSSVANDEDPLIGLSSVMGQLDSNESTTLALTISAGSPRYAKRLRNTLLAGRSPRLYSRKSYNALNKLGYLVVRSVVTLVSLALGLINELTKPNHYKDQPSKLDHQLPSISIDNPLTVAQLDKLYEPLFKTRLKLTVSAKQPERRRTLINNVELSLSDYAGNGYQRLKRTSNAHSSDIYSSSELAVLFHLPKMPSLESVYKLNSFKQLPLGHEFKVEKTGSLLGINNYQGRVSELTLSTELKQKHLYICGATGSGKSALMASLITQDIKSGRGISLIDPHGDLAEEVLRSVPKERQADVIYFNPSDLDFPIGLNLLELKSYPNSKGYRMETDQITESVISLFRKLFSEDDSGGHRVEYIIRNSVHSALSVNDCTIFTIFRILTDTSFRLNVIGKLKNQNLINFWNNELGKAGDYQRVKMSAGVTTKIGRLLFSEPARRVFGQSKSTINFEDLINENKILICNFSKGTLGEDGAKLFAVATLTKLQLAALARSRLDMRERKPHYLYVDEFQNFATESFAQMLAESRKYKLFLTIAEQSPAQQDHKLTSVILANMATVISFRNSSPADERLLLPLFEPYLNASDLLNLPAYHFYLKTVGEQSSSPVSGVTIKPPENSNDLVFNQVIDQSRQKYALNLPTFKSTVPAGRQLKLL